MTDDSGWLARAVELARLSPVPDPNPRVGAAIVKNGVLVGEGHHRGAGTPHAEVDALAAAGADARGATAYVSLEPCNHTGRTGPCAQALIDAGIARVVYGQADPNAVAAGGAAHLREAGVDVLHLEDPAADALNREWSASVTLGRPFVTWKVAATLDGHTAAPDGTSRWITSSQARADVHELRARCGAIIVGTGTVLADDPSLTVRHEVAGPHPLRVVIGTRELPAGARVFDDAAPTLRAADPAAALAALQERGVRHALLEGGPTLAASFLRAGVVDEVIAYVAPALLGGGAPTVGDLGIETISDIRRFELDDVARVGPDVRLTLSPPPRADRPGAPDTPRPDEGAA